ncbi:MAG: hypothetical protein KME06_16545 [Kastovskya adunca ATA6-11-RM4]|nr:hypothetical protein [Kastovskya adunca ATA6-11-RM4]
MIKGKTIQVKRHRTHPQSRKPDADWKIDPATEAPAVYRKFRRVMREKFAMNTSSASSNEE